MYQGLSDGRVAVVQNLNDQIEVIVLQLEWCAVGRAAVTLPCSESPQARSRSTRKQSRPLLFADGSLLIHVNKLMLDQRTLSISAEHFVKLSATGVQEW